MSAKNEKKLRQMFRGEIKGRLEQLTDEYFGGDAPVFNPKPKHVPQKLWSWLRNIIIDKGFLIQYEIRQKNKKEQERSKASESDVSRTKE